MSVLLCRHLNAERFLSKLLDDLAAAVTPDQCWEVLAHTYSDFGFNEIRFKLGGRLYTHTTNGHHVADTWTIRIRLSDNDYLNLSREFDTEAPPIVARFTDAIGKILRKKTSEILLADTIHVAVAMAVRQVQPANEVKKALQPIAAIVQNRSSRLIMPSKQN